ncbi:hypothetical protein DTO207G8_5306 [Paecilomyces variotii]|nr:hypothetical protein DTO169C6_7664 [Paecilomyces variotii]KAJ9251626.1 hypothetical protein DTO207G8_5306 [Paecilomyces variotii]KAJ9383861.1 hypothetical protein DTO063F5_4965 [Paecilomyces variotii]
MDLSEKYPPSMVLSALADHLHGHHSDLRVALSSNHPAYEEALTATMDCVHGLPDRILLPITNPTRRETLRKLALEDKALGDAPLSSSRPIRTAGRLDPEDFPKPLSPERRALLKKKFLDENDPLPREPYVLELRALRTERTLAAIVGNALITAIDYESGMPVCKLDEVEMLWDTGAATTVITKDLLDEQFQRHLADPICEAYKNQEGTRVQVSINVEFTNTLFRIDSIAWVVEKSGLPNARSGIILGQKACIDRLQYRSIPRSILEAKGEVIEEKFWGDLTLESYVDLDGSLKEII